MPRTRINWDELNLTPAQVVHACVDTFDSVAVDVGTVYEIEAVLREAAALDPESDLGRHATALVGVLNRAEEEARTLFGSQWESGAGPAPTRTLGLWSALIDDAAESTTTTGEPATSEGDARDAQDAQDASGANGDAQA